jgi:hypothetical protein
MDAMNGTEKSSETDLERAVSPHSLRSARTARSSPNDGAPLKRERSAIEDTAAALAETDPGIEEEKEIDELPNGGYGWVIVVCILALNACTWGEWSGAAARSRLGGSAVSDVPHGSSV